MKKVLNRISLESNR